MISMVKVEAEESLHLAFESYITDGGGSWNVHNLARHSESTDYVVVTIVYLGRTMNV